MSLANMLALVIAIMPISMSWDGLLGGTEASAMLEYSLMVCKMVASGLVLLQGIDSNVAFLQLLFVP